MGFLERELDVGVHVDYFWKYFFKNHFQKAIKSEFVTKKLDFLYTEEEIVGVTRKRFYDFRVRS